ncbi:MAG: vWA domain-containing protein [Longimicrobiales bacterium]
MIFRFADPAYLSLFALLPLMLWWHFRKGVRGRGSLTHPDVASLSVAAGKKGGQSQLLLALLRWLAFAAFIVALARPQTGVTGENVRSEGIDVILALDVSSSMLAEDIGPNRLEAAKDVAAAFVEGRQSDRIGLVVFAGKAFTQVPLTLDYSVVTTLMDELQVGMIEDGTAVGMGLATAVKRLQASDAASKVIVLLTDGRSNRGEIDPITAAHMARALDVRVYTIGAGSRGMARVPVPDGFGGRRYVTTRVDVDEPTLEEAASVTGGRYYRATDRASLERIYAEIDQLETTEIQVENFTQYGEEFPIPLIIGLALLVAELLLSHTFFRVLP